MMDELMLIKTPNSYIKLGATRTLLQQDSLLMVSAHLQDYVKTFFELGLHHSGAPVRPLFTKYVLEHGIPPFKIYLADMGIKAQNYQTVREAIAEMNVVVEHAELDDQGRKTGGTIFSPVFKQFRVPEHYGYIEVEINNNVAQYAFDMAQGYISHPKMIARYATKRSTPPLYFKLLMEHRNVVRLSVPEVKKAIGMEPFRDDKTGEWVVPYAKFAHFKKKVLDAVKRDLDQMVQDGHADLTFTYEPIYLGDRRRGDPDCIKFLVKRVGGNAPQAVEGDLFSNMPDDNVADGSPLKMTKEQAQDAWQRCYADFKAHLGLSGADVWFDGYDNGTVTFKYDKAMPDLKERLTTGNDSNVFTAIVRQHFGEQCVIELKKSGG